ncbi:MAG: DUF1302 family protein [Proteobacteria bacterium]|nr:DUF1302 family protein [Pseudomonadota bacterium]
MKIFRLAVAVSLGTLPGIAAAMDFQIGDDVAGKFNATLTAGTTIRTESPDPAVLGTLSTARVGLPPGRLGGNTGGNDLNFQKGQPVSTVVKGVFELELTRQNLGVFARAKAWEDFELKSGDRAYGNIPNGFRQNVPLSDNGFDPAEKFSNVRLADLYAFGRFKLRDDVTLNLRGGRQVLKWGASQFFDGGIDAINPLDYPARLRPGALAQEGRVPLGMLYADLSGGTQWGVEGFVQYEFRPSVLLPCGTFFATVSYLPSGCAYVSALGGQPFNVNDPIALANGLYPKRNPDILASDAGQYGAALRYAAAALNTELRAYAMTYHSRTPNTRITLANVAGGYGGATTTRLTDPNGIKYAAIYAENIRLYGLSFTAKADPALSLFGELAHRPNQPLTLNAADVTDTFLSRFATAALNRAKNTNALAPGSSFDSYDRYPVTTASLGANQVLSSAGAILSGEIGWSHIAGLPGPGILRYGRSEDYGVAAVDGGAACIDTTAARKSCAQEGFITSNAWGYRLRLAANYPDSFFGARLTLSLAFAQDVNGYSYNGSFLKGRRVLRPGLRADWNRRYFSEIIYTRVAGGDYNNQVDRDNLVLAVGANF